MTWDSIDRSYRIGEEALAVRRCRFLITMISSGWERIVITLDRLVNVLGSYGGALALVVGAQVH